MPRYHMLIIDETTLIDSQKFVEAADDEEAIATARAVAAIILRGHPELGRAIFIVREEGVGRLVHSAALRHLAAQLH